ncbi:MAG: hypothetical protein HYS18_01205 [Burkholderiales bacterium]|nr:hypothetical protein [Burkholderiales bacterium]
MMTFLLVASRGPVLLSQLNTQSPLSQKNFDEPVAFLSQRDQGEQFSAVITVFSAVDGRDKWIALTARGRELFSLIQRSAYSSRIAA